ncbi:MAG: hypothetical protein LBQ15_00265 [Clostridium sp.]|jgi:hypothetical protein|nr:hypothetical protein [Clostridium sp.]
MTRNRLYRKTWGKVELVTGMFFLILMILILAVHMQIMLFYITSQFMEDALAASNLASAVIDIEEYGRTHILRIASPETAYVSYQEALKGNLQLNADWESSSKELAAGKVEILEYIIYNVNGDDVTVSRFGQSGRSTWLEKGGVGKIKAPDGTLIETTSVYSRIGFPVEGILGISTYAEKEKSVDVVSKALAASEAEQTGKRRQTDSE